MSTLRGTAGRRRMCAWMGRPGVLALPARWGPQKRRGRGRAVGKTALGRSPLEQNLQGRAICCLAELETAGRPEGQPGRSAEM